MTREPIRRTNERAQELQAPRVTDDLATNVAFNRLVINDSNGLM